MNSDAYFEMGAGHTVCQDYAIAGELDGFHYVLGADGCSKSAKSDLGARLICEAARKILEINDSFVGADRMKSQLLQEMNQLRIQLRLDPKNFDSTFWFAAMGSGVHSVYGWGDGVIRREYDDGSLSIEKVEFTSGAPRYLSYGLSERRYQNYLAECPGKVNIHFYYKYADHPIVEGTREAEVDGFFYELQEENNGGGRQLTMLSVMSDGANTFRHKDSKQCTPFHEATESVCDYINKNGRFVERQIHWLANENRKKGIIHSDDLFCGSIHNPVMTEQERQKLMEELAMAS